MKYTIEQLLDAARAPKQHGDIDFTKRTMAAVAKHRVHETFDAALRTTNTTKKERLFMRLRKLPTGVLVAIVLGLVVFAGGVVYAATQYAPLLVKVLHKSVNERGAPEYEIGHFQDCALEGTVSPVKFELKKDAPPLGDDDVRRILQARCETQWVSTFASKQWPTYGTHAKWQDGDRIYYARPDVMGEVVAIHDNAVTLRLGDGSIKTLPAQKGQKITAFGNGEQLPLTTIMSGDPVYAVTRASEIHHEKQWTAPEQPHEEGIIGVVKLSLPLKFYGNMQNYLTDIQECYGNKGEYCPQTGGIEVFPREGGEAARNPELHIDQTSIGREISGVVKTFDANTMTIQSRAGHVYKVVAPANAFSDYNQQYAEAYGSYGTMKVGSTVSITYAQPPKSDPHTITASQIQTIFLQLDMLSPKQDAIKQY